MSFAMNTLSDARAQTELLIPRPSALSRSCLPSNAPSRHRLAQTTQRTAVFEQSSLYSAYEEPKSFSSTPHSFASSMSLFCAIDEIRDQVPGLAVPNTFTGFHHTYSPTESRPVTPTGYKPVKDVYSSNGKASVDSDCLTLTACADYPAKADQHVGTRRPAPTIVRLVAVETPNLFVSVMFNK